jgi:hypothetical protein
MISDIKKTPKNAKILECKDCSFKCNKQSEWTRHINTTKHINRINGIEKTRKTPKLQNHICECGKKYKYSRGLWEHKKKCSYISETQYVNIQTTTDKDKLILDLLAQNKEFMTLLSIQQEETKDLVETIQEQNKVIQGLVPKIGNNNTTTNNNQFNLQVFLNEDCKDAINFSEFIENIKITFEDLEHQAEVGYINGVSKLFIENLRELGTHKRPIHCTDKKRKTLYIKENNEWDKEGSQNTLKKGIREVSRKGFECLMKEKEENQEEYKDIESDFTQKCLSIHRNILPGVPQETTISKVIEKISQNSGINE